MRELLPQSPADSTVSPPDNAAPAAADAAGSSDQTGVNPADASSGRSRPRRTGAQFRGEPRRELRSQISIAVAV
ncbi:MAG: hypothetical protein M3462_10140, partial [Chloroflexota bacterium]|nr:hypothetical protein [Chloroflexota bacterium]